jgi:hypothetical protein
LRLHHNCPFATITSTAFASINFWRIVCSDRRISKAELWPSLIPLFFPPGEILEAIAKQDDPAAGTSGLLLAG